MEPIQEKDRLVGVKQVLKALGKGQLRCVYIADDVDTPLRSRLVQACETAGVEIRRAATMKELGAACGIDVGAACAGMPGR